MFVSIVTSGDNVASDPNLFSQLFILVLFRSYKGAKGSTR